MNLTRGFAVARPQVTVLSMNTVKHQTDVSEIPEAISDLAEFRLVEVPAKISFLHALINLLFSAKPYNAIRFISINFQRN